MSSVPIKWQRIAVEKAAQGADDAAWFHEQRKDAQAASARSYANSLHDAALTLKSLEMEGGLRGKGQRRAANG